VVPGFPWPVFLVLGVVLLGTYVWQSRYEFAITRRLLSLDEPVVEEQGGVLVDDDPLAPPKPVMLVLDAGTYEVLTHTRVQSAVNDEVTRIRDEYGVPVPMPAIRSAPGLTAGGYRLEAHGVRLATGQLRVEEYFLLKPAAVDGDARGEFQPRIAGEWLPAETDESARDSCDLLAVHVGMGIRHH